MKKSYNRVFCLMTQLLPNANYSSRYTFKSYIAFISSSRVTGTYTNHAEVYGKILVVS
ncbi:hypothetical protein [Acidianus sp. HS-5]|uniref:hypothetical protein n=1 Tax=Acidianus sp. HS-5 TaxID=2886040 RepID=UPI001F1A4555|nr:hypothetical protein [Acidianus sp. HS-5]